MPAIAYEPNYCETCCCSPGRIYNEAGGALSRERLRDVFEGDTSRVTSGLYTRAYARTRRTS
jgi:hypothetical protein